MCTITVQSSAQNMIVYAANLEKAIMSFDPFQSPRAWLWKSWLND